MPDTRHPTYPPNENWDNCQHEWKDVESMSDRSVRCVKCGCPGDRADDDSVYWPTT